MPVIAVERRLNASVLSHDADGKYEVTDQWQAFTDSPYDSAAIVGLDPRVPQIRQQYYTYLGVPVSAWCKSRTIRAIDSRADGKVWLIEAKFDSETDPAVNPLQRRSRPSFSFAKHTRVIEYDEDGRAVLNSARQIFDPPIEDDDSRPLIKFRRNELTFNPALAVAYQDAINSDEWWGLEPGQAKMQAITGEPRTENGIDYYEVTYEIELKRDTWIKRILDRGYAYKKEGKLKVITDEELVPHPIPVNLDGQGGLLPDDADPVFLEFRTLKSLPFSRLALI